MDAPRSGFRRYAVWIARSLWGSAAIFVLGISLWVYTPANDAPLVLAYGMLFLSFPSGLLLTLAMMFPYMGVAGLFGFSETGYVTMVVQWSTMAVAGYWQWFICVPWIWRKIAASRKTQPTPSVSGGDGEVRGPS